MINFFSEELRRDPFPGYERMRQAAPVFHEKQSGLWLHFDYASVKRALTDPETFSSRLGPAEWMIFVDPPRHGKLRALVAQAFAPRSVADLEPRILQLTRELINERIESGEMDLVRDFSLPLPMIVISEMLGSPAADRPLYYGWNNVLLKMSHTLPGGAAGESAMREFVTATQEMGQYLSALITERRSAPRNDLLTRLVQAEIDGERLTADEILGFFQLLLLAGSETTSNLLSNAILCFMEHPDQRDRIIAERRLLPGAIEEVLRYRSPVQWMFRVVQREVTLHGETIPAGSVVLLMLGSANRDAEAFPMPEQFDSWRTPNPHLAFGQGIHSCLGAALGRLEGKVALGEFLDRIKGFRRTSQAPWTPGSGLHVHGPSSLPLQFSAGPRLA